MAVQLRAKSSPRARGPSRTTNPPIGTADPPRSPVRPLAAPSAARAARGTKRRLQVALLIETSNAYACGLLEGITHYLREHQS